MTMGLVPAGTTEKLPFLRFSRAGWINQAYFVMKRCHDHRPRILFAYEKTFKGQRFQEKDQVFRQSCQEDG